MSGIEIDEFHENRPVTILGLHPLLAAESCVLHDDERLPSYYRELHHVMPQVWQTIWWPDKFDVAAPVSHHASKQPWDPRTEPCCPTGHRNVHYILVFLMKLWQQDYQVKPHTQTAIKACRAKGVKLLHASDLPASPNEVSMAANGMLRWDEWGGDLSLLTARKLYGYA